MAPPALRPENAIRRADELVSVGEPMAGLQSLFDLLSSRRSRFADAATLEPIIFKFLELGVELRKGKMIKEGLYQYKKHMQHTTEGLHSVGAVARKFIDLIEKKMTTVQAQADAKDQANEADDDLEGGVTPENLLVSVYEQEQTVGGFNNDDVSAWLRFTWESYRTTLDFLRNNSQLEITYAGVVNRTMQFCYKYNRKNEFKRLAEMLRQHLDAANYQQQRYGHHTVDLSDADTLQRYSDQRFQQVNVSVKLELWHEAFRSIEDVHHLMRIAKRPPKPSVLANYYENLAKIFFVSGNYLLHAAAWEKFYNLYLKNPNATDEDFKFYASQFLLSALAIQLDDLPIAGFDPQIRLCDLLDLESKPKRKDLITAATDSKILEKADPEILKFFDILETNFNVRTVKDQLSELLPKLQDKPYFAQYVTPLRNLFIRRSIIEVAKEQTSIHLVELHELLSLPAPFELSVFELEKYLIQAAMDDYVSITIDHETDTVTFAQDPFDAWQASLVETASDETKENDSEEETQEGSEESSEEEQVEQVFTRNSEVRSKLTDLSKILKANEEYEKGSYYLRVKLVREELVRQKEEVIKREKEAAEIRAKNNAERKKRNEEEKKLAAKRAMEERHRRMIEEKAAVESSMEKEAERRAQEMMEREREAIHEQEMKKLIEETNANGVIYIDPKEAKNMTSEKINQMVIEQVAKNKKDMTERMTFAFKRLDHLERAYRQMELPLLEKDAQQQKDRDMENYEAFKKKLIESAKADFEKKLELHNRLNKIYGSFKEYRTAVSKAKKEQIEQEKELKKSQLEEAKKQRIEQVRKERYEAKVAEIKAAIEAEEQRKEALAKEAELEKRRAERDRINRERDEIARKQREIEELLEKKNSASRASASPIPARASPSPAASTSTPPPSNKPMSMAEKLRLKRMQKEAGRG